MARSLPITFQHDRPQVETDLYGRKSFAEQVGRLLALPPASPGIVVGIEGPWGSGKTTVVRYIVEALKTASKTHPIVVEFNPWMLAGADALVEALLTELASGIGMDGRKKRAKKSLEAAGKILGYAGLLRHLKYLKYVPGVSLVGVAADTVGTALHDAGELAIKAADTADNARKVVEETEKLVSVKAGLGERKKAVIKALGKLDRSIVVIVDDLDRLTPDEIKAVFRTIKAVADFPRVAYLLAYDRNVISESLGGGPIAGGEAYIEKIVQVAYPISPAFPWQLQGHITGEITSLLERINRELEPFESELFARATSIACNLCRYPRDIVRLTNRLTLSLESTKHEVNAADVIVAEALFQRFPKIREAVVRNPEQFTGAFWSIADEARATDWSMYFTRSKEERRTAWQAHLPEDKADNAAATAALRCLFPLTGGVGPSSYPRSQLRLSELSRLIRFFALTSVAGVHEVADIHNMLAEPSQIGELLQEVDYNSAAEIVNHMTAYLDTAKAVDGVGVARQLLKACLANKPDMAAGRDFSRAVAILLANCLEICGETAHDIITDFVSSAPLTYALDFLTITGMSHGEVRGVDSYKISEAPVFVADASVIASSIDLWRRRAGASMTSGKVMAENDFFAVLYGLGNLGRASRNADAIDAFRRFCTDVKGGLEFFLETARPFKQFQAELFYYYVWDADEMAGLLETSSVSDQYSWYLTCLRDDKAVREFIKARNDG
ncbi:KAP family P-loop NTPase fold protein [Paraburkholderia azotifigens]|uniref:P-loop NTPase fold protein n=1 Tax=Paraburkholderia azotifigens TaxID=2057004 RepID=A0ABU9RDS5_9BURK